jgi:hypothetical protein
MSPAFYSILGAIGGIIITLVTKFGAGWINEYYETRKLRRERKVQASHDINSFCIEGMHKGFRIRAGSEQHIKFRAAEIEAIDVSTGIKLRQFIDSWSQCRNFQKKNPMTVEDEKIAMEFGNKAQKLGDELLLTVKKWAK